MGFRYFLSTLPVLCFSLMTFEASARPISLSEVCRWVTAQGSNPFEWLQKNEVVQIKEQSDRILNLMGPRFRDLLLHLDGTRSVTLTFDLNDRSTYREIVRRFGQVGINRLTSSSWAGLPHRESVFGLDRKITVFEKDPHALLFAIRTVTDLDPGSQVNVNYDWFTEPLSNIERLMTDQDATRFKRAKPDDEFEMLVRFKLNRPHFLHRAREFRSMPGIEVVDESYKGAQAVGYLTLWGTPEVLRKALASDEIDRINWQRTATKVTQ